MTQLTHCLTKIATHWLDPEYDLRQRAIAEGAHEFCLSKPSFSLALDWIFSQWTELTLTPLIAQQAYKKSTYAAQILAGNTPAMIAQGFLQGAILNIPQCIKIPSKQSTFARLLHQSFTEHLKQWQPLCEIYTGENDSLAFYAKLKQADLVIVYGRDETIATLKKYIAPGAISLLQGHAESAAIIFKEAADVKYLEKLAYDMLSYDQRGCLSPRVTFIEQGGALSPAECAQLFSEEVLPMVAQQLSRGGLFPGEAAEILHQRIVYGFRGQVYTGADWTVCYTEQQGWPTEALPRFMSVKSFSSSNELMNVLQPIKKHLISVGCAGPEKKRQALQQELNATRFCALGEMQKQLLFLANPHPEGWGEGQQG